MSRYAYVADGHHRSASAWRAGKELRPANPRAPGRRGVQLVPGRALSGGAAHASCRTTGWCATWTGRAPRRCWRALRRVGQCDADRRPRARPRPGTFCVYLAGAWYRLELDAATIDRRDPIGSLDVSLLQDRVLGPILGIGDPRTDKRIDFVGGIRGTAELERRVDSGEMAIAFSLYPTTLDQLMAVSDAGAGHAAQEHLVRAEAEERAVRA